MAFSSVRMHKNSAHIHVIAAHAMFNNHQNRVGNDPLYHTQIVKCMTCIVQEKSKHNRYLSTIYQINVALSAKNFVRLFDVYGMVNSSYPLSAFKANTTMTNFSLVTALNS